MTSAGNIPQLNRPGVISSFTKGFNAAANNVQWILIPIGFDILLWLGPHLRIKKLGEPLLLEMGLLFKQIKSENGSELYDSVLKFWDTLLEHYNLFSSLSTLPIGIPGLMVGIAPIETPFGLAINWEINTFFGAIIMWIMLSFLGIVIGGYYFSRIAEISSPEHVSKSLGKIFHQIVQSIILTLLLTALLLIILLPTSILLSLLTIFSPVLFQFAMLLISIGIIWFGIPLVFSPHGIFVDDKSAVQSIWNSLRMTRFLLPGTGMFILLAIMLNQVMSIIWIIPPESSWMALVGIAGHAFIITGLISSSFIYYRNGMNYTEGILTKILTPDSRNVIGPKGF